MTIVLKYENLISLSLREIHLIKSHATSYALTIKYAIKCELYKRLSAIHHPSLTHVTLTSYYKYARSILVFSVVIDVDAFLEIYINQLKVFTDLFLFYIVDR